MNSSGSSFWKHVYNLRERGLIPRVWKAGHLRAYLQDPVGPSYSPNTVNVYPSNSSVSAEGNSIGDFVLRGAVPKFWRVGRGQYQLVADPEDDEQTQRAELERAIARAKAVRSSRTQASRSLIVATSPSLQYEADSRTQSPSALTGMFPSVEVEMTAEDRQAMSGLSTTEKAVCIVRKHLLERFGPDAEIKMDEESTALRISVGTEQIRIEVNGTDTSVMDWEHMKISDQRAHYALTSGGAAMYRVVNISGSNPRIYILSHGEHFTLEPEPAWAVKKVVLKDEKYPLRGEPYTYDQPFEPVAEGEWEVMA